MQMQCQKDVNDKEKKVQSMLIVEDGISESCIHFFPLKMESHE